MRSFKDHIEDECLDEGIRDVFSAVTKRVWKSLSAMWKDVELPARL